MVKILNSIYSIAFLFHVIKYWFHCPWAHTSVLKVLHVEIFELKKYLYDLTQIKKELFNFRSSLSYFLIFFVQLIFILSLIWYNIYLA